MKGLQCTVWISLVLTEERRNNERVCFSQNVRAMNLWTSSWRTPSGRIEKPPDANVFPALGHNLQSCPLSFWECCVAVSTPSHIPYSLISPFALRCLLGSSWGVDIVTCSRFDQLAGKQLLRLVQILSQMAIRTEGGTSSFPISPTNDFKGWEERSTWLLGFCDSWIHATILLFSVELPQSFESFREADFMLKTSGP